MRGVTFPRGNWYNGAMKKLPTASDSSASDTHDKGGVSSLQLIASMADTTWRMFVPTIGLLVAGNALDGRFSSKPWLMLTGATVGGLIAAYLVKIQLRKGQRS